MSIKVRRNGAWVDATIKKRVNGAWADADICYVRTPNMSGVPPFTFKSDGVNLRDWSMTGQTVQASTPTPSSPVAVEGVGTLSGSDYVIPVNVQSGNLFDPETATLGKYIDNNGVEQTSGNAQASQKTNHSDYFDVEPNASYSFASVKSDTVQKTVAFVWYTSAKTFISRTVADIPTSTTDYSMTATAPSNAEYAIINYTTANNEVMLNRGSTPLPYQPYSNTTTNIYLGTATSTRRIKKLVLTGNETVSSVTDSTLESGAYCFACLYSDLGMTDIIDYDLDMRDIPYPYYVSDHFNMRATPTQQIVPYTDLYAGEMGANARKGGGTSNRTFNRYIIFCVSGISTVADFKAWLAAQYANGTPVTIWYVLATEETSATNEPLMKIGTYVDELTKTGTGVNISTVSGSNTLSVNTTVQPSEMSIESISQWVEEG